MIDIELFKLIGKNKKYIFIVVLLMVLSLAFTLGITSTICATLYVALNNLESINYLYLAIAAIVFLDGKFLITYIVGKLKDKIGREVKKDIRSRTYNKILKLGTRSHGDVKLAGLTQISVEGIEQLDLYYSIYLPQFFYSLLAPIILFILTSFISFNVSIVLLCCVPLIPISIVLVSKYAKKIFAKYWGKYISMGDSFLDTIQGLKELKLYKADEAYEKKMLDKSEEFRIITMKVLIMQLASTTIMDLVAFGGAGIGVSIALSETINGTLTPISALFLMLIAVEFFLPLRSLGSAFHVAMNGVSAGKKIMTLLKEKETSWGDKAFEGGDIAFKNVSFKYEDGNKFVLSNVNLNFESNKFTAIVGVSGSGKSTIVSLLTRQNLETSGEVLANNHKIEDYSRESFYKNFVVLSSNTYVFNDTIRNNFKMANENVSDEEIIKALKEVKLENLVSQEKGLDSIINEDANNISGGEKQRLALAINLTQEKKIYIFDEATSNIDIESETIIMKKVGELSKDHTVILISHRLENVKNADKIYFLENGRIIEEGNHKKLINQNGAYSKLYKTQKDLENAYKDIHEVLTYAK